MLDCMEPTEEYTKLIIDSFGELGLDLNDLKAILITHGHGDHYGTANYFRDNYGCKVYMSKTDYEYARNDTSGPMGALTWEIKDFLEDGDVFELGSLKLYVFSTPGHTPGCLSFVFNVTDEGRPHMAALWGGTGIPRSAQMRMEYLKSTIYFAKQTEALGVDVEIATHPFVDAGLQRLEVLRSMPDGVPNPFVLGKEGYKYYEQMFQDICIEALTKDAVKLDELDPPKIRR